MSKQNNRICAYIDLNAVEKNVESMEKLISPHTKMIAVVKADGYGHGAIEISKHIQPKDCIWGFAVATVEEAAALRQNGIEKPILVLSYVFPDDYELLVQMEVRPTVFRYEMAQKLSAEAVKLQKKLPIHIGIDTGMTRIGFRNLEESVEEIKKIHQLPNINIEGIFTHFANADEEDLTSTHRQYEKFQRCIQRLEMEGISIPMKHCNNSAGIMWHRTGDLNAVRPGIILYGVAPSSEVHNTGMELHPAMTLKTHISYVKNVEAGVAVSYGGTYVTSKEVTKIATIPVGYADGYPRSLSNKGYVLIHGKKAPIIGRICMDQFMVDVTHIPEAKMEDEVTLMGKDGDCVISVEELGETSGRFSYEFICCINKRVPRVYIK